MKWKTIQRKFPDTWVAIKPETMHTFDGEVVYHHKNSNVFHKKAGKVLDKFKLLSVAFTGNPIRIPKNYHVCLSIW
jgi:hypothetical protein